MLFCYFEFGKYCGKCFLFLRFCYYFNVVFGYYLIRIVFVGDVLLNFGFVIRRSNVIENLLLSVFFMIKYYGRCDIIVGYINV